MLAALLVLSTLLSTAPAASAAPAGDTAAVVPVHQSLDLTLDPRTEHWYGELITRLDVRRPTRYLRLRRHGTEVHRVELAISSGRAELLYGVTPGDTLLIETRAALPAGPAELNVMVGGPFDAAADSARGLVRHAGGIVLRHAFGGALPAWPGSPATPWEVTVHVPAGYTVRTNLPRRERSGQGGWRAWSFATSRALPADSLRLEVSAPAASPRGAHSPRRPR